MKSRSVFIRIRLWHFCVILAISVASILFASLVSLRRPFHLEKCIQVAPMVGLSQHPVHWRPGFSFEHWIDSVKKDSGRSRELDSVFRVRPGMADSILAAENYNQFLHFLKK